MELAGLEVAGLVLAFFVGAVVRGYAGFGAGLIWVSSLTLVVDPAEAIPVVVMAEIIVSSTLYRRSRSEIAWPQVRQLVAGAVVGLPVGVAILASAPATTMRVVIAVLVLLSAVVLAGGWQLRRDPGPPATVGTGVASGVMNGVTGAGGPPVIVFFLGSPTGVAVGRASMSIYFGVVDAVAVAVLAVSGLIDPVTLIRLAVLAPAVFLGARLGERGFESSRPERVRRFAIALLVVLAVVGLLTV